MKSTAKVQDLTAPGLSLMWFNVEQKSSYPGQLSSSFMSHSTFCVVRSSLAVFLVRLFCDCRNDDWCAEICVFLEGLTSVTVEQPCPVEVWLVPSNVVIIG